MYVRFTHDRSKTSVNYHENEINIYGNNKVGLITELIACLKIKFINF